MSEYTVISEISAVKISDDADLEKVYYSIYYTTDACVRCLLLFGFDILERQHEVGTHTHVQTADKQVSQGTGYITDLGMCGDASGIIGVETKGALGRFLGQSISFKPGSGAGSLSGILAEIDTDTGECISIERVSYT